MRRRSRTSIRLERRVDRRRLPLPSLRRRLGASSEFDFQTERVSRPNLTLEANAVNSREKRDLAAIFFKAEYRYRSDLGEGFDDENAGSPGNPENGPESRVLPLTHS